MHIDVTLSSKKAVEALATLVDISRSFVQENENIYGDDNIRQMIMQENKNSNNFFEDDFNRLFDVVNLKEKAENYNFY